MRRNFLKLFGSMFSSAQSLKMINFCKNAYCPSSPVLLDFQKGELSTEESRAIRRHLTECEFCAAETEFYARFPQAEDACGEAETAIPAPLYQLAEALLGSRQTNFTLLKKLLGENENLTLEKA